ncbi:MAG: Hint domain-containing protein [Pseudomonadota bacterium]
MSVRSKFEAASRGSYDDAVTRLRTGASRLMAERARAMQSAANQQDECNTRQSSPEVPVLDAWPLPGLGPMTRVRTSFGDVHAAALRRGDEVLTRSGEYKAIQWLTRICLDEQLLKEKPDCNPVVLAAGSLAPQIPANEISVSPRQIVLPHDTSALTRAEEAARLVRRPGVRRLRETSLSYTMFHVGAAAEVYCEGVYLMFPMDA